MTATKRIRIDDALIQRALAVDAAAVDELVRTLQGPFFDLARRVVLDPADAEDAAQEALLRVVTHLAQFDGRARFSTWAWRIAVNACLDARARRYRLPVLSDEAFGADLADGLDAGAPERPEDAALLTEVKIGCGIAMLSTLDGDHRAAYVLVLVRGDQRPRARLSESPLSACTRIIALRSWTRQVWMQASAARPRRTTAQSECGVARSKSPSQRP